MEQEPSCLRSPSSSPSLAAVDSSPPSSPDRTAITPPASPGARDPFAGSSKSIKRPRIYERNGSQKSIGSESIDLTEVTPTRLTRVVDPLSGSAKPEWVPPTYEKKTTRVASNESAKSVSSSSFYTYASRAVRGYTSPTPRSNLVPTELDEPDDFSLTDDEADAYKPSPGEAELLKPSAGPKSREELEQKLWDEGIANAIDKLNGTIDLSGSSLRKGAITHIPPSIADLEGFIILPSTHSTSSAPPSPTVSPVGSSRQLTRATTLAAPQFDAPFFRSRDGERLRGTPAARAASLQAVAQPPPTQRRRRDIHIYLANNSISKLPPELFRVNALTVLSLRSNYLTFVPPQIVQLKALQELNLAQNKLRWLPAEMLTMRLTKLTVSGNPWLSPPPALPRQAGAPTPDSTERRRPVSDTLVRFVVPPLSEICLRILLVPAKPPSLPSSSRAHSAMPPPATTPASSSRPHEQSQPEPGPLARQLTVLEARYALPLSEDDHYSPALLRTLRACVPAAVARPSEFDCDGRVGAKVRRLDDVDDEERNVHSAGGFKRGRGAETDEDGDVFTASLSTSTEEDVTGVSECPCPAHGHDGAQGAVYVRHTEERWTWEEVVAGVHVGAEGTGGVPVRWRGCGRGCLAFLDPPFPSPAQAPASYPVPEPALGEQQTRERVPEGTGEGEEQETQTQTEEEEFELELDLDIGLGGGVSGAGGAGSGFGDADVDVDTDMEDVW